MQPLVSIIIPLYNTEQYLSSTLDSVLSQTYSNWELIIVDDHSTDNSYAIAEQYAIGDERIKLIRRNSQLKGGSVCRNIGIKKAEGKYIIFLDSDDLLYNKCLENRVAYMEEELSLDFCVFQMEIISPDNTKQNIYLTHKEDNYLYAFLSYRLAWQTSCPIWKSEFIRENMIGFDERFPRLQDPEFHTRALLVENIRYQVLDDFSYLDSAYRFEFKKSNISNTITGFELYANMVCDKIKDRRDYNNCIKALYGTYEAMVYHYSVSEESDLRKEVSKMNRVNSFFYSKKIINKKLYFKTNIFLHYIQYNLYKSSFINKLLLKIGFDHFYGYRFDTENK